jgi:hypothetical protein
VTVAIIATPGAANANSYVTIDEADAYFSYRFGASAWQALSSANKEIALRHSTQSIDQQRLRGYQVQDTQALAFPRYIPGSWDASGLLYPSTDIPQAVKDACCEEALWLAQNASTGGMSPRQQLQAEGVSSFMVGNLQESYSGGRHVQLLGPRAQTLLRQWIDRGGQVLDTTRERGLLPCLPRVN